MAKVQKVNADENIGVINEILERDGCIIIENALDTEQLDRLKQELRPHFEETPNCTGDFYGHATKRVSSLIAKSELCQHMAIDPVVLAAMDKFLLRGCGQYSSISRRRSRSDRASRSRSCIPTIRSSLTSIRAMRR